MKNLLRKILADPSFPRKEKPRTPRRRALAHVVMFTPDGNRELVPVFSEGHAAFLVARGYKPGESYREANRRNYKRSPTPRVVGSVRLHGG